MSSASASATSASASTSTTTTKFRVEHKVSSSSAGKRTAYAADRSLLDPKDVVIKRRFGEGSRPLFQREDIAVNVRGGDDGQHEATSTCLTPASSSAKSAPRRGPRTPSRSSPESNSPERYRAYARRTSRSPAKVARRTPEKVPYFFDQKREKDRLRRIYGTGGSSRAADVPPVRSRSRPRARPPSPPPVGSELRRRSSITPNRLDCAAAHTKRLRVEVRHRSSLSGERERIRRHRHRRSCTRSRSREREREREHTHVHAHAHLRSRKCTKHRDSDSRERERERECERERERERERELSRKHGHGRPLPPQIITIPVPVPEYSYAAFSGWPGQHDWLAPGGRHPSGGPPPPPPPRYAPYPLSICPPLPPYRSPYGLQPPYGSRLFRPPPRHFAPRPNKRPFHRRNY